MTDNAAGYKLGDDILKLNEIETVEIDTSETIAAGDGLKITGVNGTRLKVGQSTAGTKARFVAQEAGVAGDLIRALRRGKTKVTFGGAVTVGDAIKAGAVGKFVKAVYTVTQASGSTTVLSTSAGPTTLTVESGIGCGFTYQTITSDTDKGLIFFSGAN